MYLLNVLRLTAAKQTNQVDCHSWVLPLFVYC